MIGNIEGLTNEQLLELREKTESEWSEDSTIDACFAMSKTDREIQIEAYRKLLEQIDAELEKRTKP